MSLEELNCKRPLPAGTVIEYCGDQAKVVKDDGLDYLIVEVDGKREKWYWKFEGVSCTVVSVAGSLEELNCSRPLPAGTVIEYCGEQAKVVKDDGLDYLIVEVDGHRDKWYWKFEGVACTVVPAAELCSI